jgi:hypothetical protein
MLKINFKNAAEKNLQELSIELVSEYIQETLIPAMVQQKYNIAPDHEEYENDMKSLY